MRGIAVLRCPVMMVAVRTGNSGGPAPAELTGGIAAALPRVVGYGS